MRIFKKVKPNGKENGIRHVWGIVSCGSLIDEKQSSLYTLNDLDISYIIKKDKYVLGVETCYFFETVDQEYKHLRFLLSKFTEWMVANKYAINTPVNLHNVFSAGQGINTQFDSIEEAYAMFRFLVNGYCAQQ